jgi:hypothetical protein
VLLNVHKDLSVEWENIATLPFNGERHVLYSVLVAVNSTATVDYRLVNLSDEESNSTDFSTESVGMQTVIIPVSTSPSNDCVLQLQAKVDNVDELSSVLAVEFNM